MRHCSWWGAESCLSAASFVMMLMMILAAQAASSTGDDARHGDGKSYRWTSFVGHADAVRSLAFGADDFDLVSADASGSVVRWDILSEFGQTSRVSECTVVTAAVSGEGSKVAVAVGSSLRVVETTSLRVVATIDIAPLVPTMLKFSPDGLHLLAADMDSVAFWSIGHNTFSTQRVIDSSSVARPSASRSGLLTCFLSDDGPLTSPEVAVCIGNKVESRNMVRGSSKLLFRTRSHITAFAVEPQSLDIATGGEDGSVEIGFGSLGYRGDGAQCVEAHRHRSRVTAVAFAGNGIVFSADEGGHIYRWAIAPNEPNADAELLPSSAAFKLVPAGGPLEGHLGPVDVLAVSLLGDDVIASAGRDSAILLWRSTTTTSTNVDGKVSSSKLIHADRLAQKGRSYALAMLAALWSFLLQVGSVLLTIVLAILEAA